MRRSKQCPKCHSVRIGVVRNEKKERYLGYVGKEELIGVVVTSVSTPAVPLVSLVCADCGLVETYAAFDSEAELEALIGFRWLNPAAGESGPYR